MADQEKGCLYCTDTAPLPDEGHPHEIYIVDNTLYWYDRVLGYEGLKIHYCPMCGRRLEERDV